MPDPGTTYARPTPEFDPLDDQDEDGREQATEADAEDPAGKRRKEARDGADQA